MNCERQSSKPPSRLRPSPHPAETKTPAFSFRPGVFYFTCFLFPRAVEKPLRRFHHRDIEHNPAEKPEEPQRPERHGFEHALQERHIQRCPEEPEPERNAEREQAIGEQVVRKQRFLKRTQRKRNEKNISRDAGKHKGPRRFQRDGELQDAGIERKVQERRKDANAEREPLYRPVEHPPLR